MLKVLLVMLMMLGVLVSLALFSAQKRAINFF